MGEERRHEIARDELPVFVDEEAAIGVAVPGDTDFRAAGLDPLDDIAPIFLD